MRYDLFLYDSWFSKIDKIRNQYLRCVIARSRICILSIMLTVRNNLHGLHGSCSLVVRFVSQVMVCYIDYGVLYIEAFKLEERIRLPETFIILHHLWGYVLDLMLCPHHSCISVQTQAFGPSYINHVV